MKIVALITVHNEERMIPACLRHLEHEGLNYFVINDRCTDGTMEYVKIHAGPGLIGTADMPFEYDHFNLSRTLEFKLAVARELDADWLLHLDADELRGSNQPNETLAQAITRIDAEGFNAINFQEFTFVPTHEDAEHHPASFNRTMRWYYPFLPQPLHRLNAWKKQGNEVDLVSDGGHRVHFAGRKVYHQSLHLRHYLYISRDHFSAKYKNRIHIGPELEKNWHGWREKATDAMCYFPPQSAMRPFDPETPWQLDASSPRTQHMLMDDRPPIPI